MKKLLTFIIVIGLTTFLACGPNAKEKAEKARLDSIAKHDSIEKSEKNKSDRFLGTWKASDGLRTMTISKAGETAFTIEVSAKSGSVYNSGTYTATYQDGNLVQMGQVVASFSNGKVIVNGTEFNRIN